MKCFVLHLYYTKYRVLAIVVVVVLYAPWQFVFYDNLQVSFVLLFYALVLCGCVSLWEWERQSFYASPLIRQLSYSCCWQNICCPIVYRETVIDKRKRNVAALQRQRHLRSHRALGMWHTCDWETTPRQPNEAISSVLSARPGYRQASLANLKKGLPMSVCPSVCRTRLPALFGSIFGQLIRLN